MILRRPGRPTAMGLGVLLALAVGAPAATAASGWAPTADPLTNRFNGMATVLTDGRVLTVGGTNRRAGISSVTALYDPAAGSWTATGESTRARRFGTVTTLRDGRVLLAAGYSYWRDDDPVEGTAELYDPATGRWTFTAPLAHKRQGHVAALLPDGRVLVAGGVDRTGAPVTQAEIYDPATGTWSGGGTMAQAGYRSQSAVLPDGRVLVAGGSTTSPVPATPPFGVLDDADMTRTEIFDPATTTWSPADPLAAPRAQGGAALLDGGRVLVAAGVGAAGAEASATAFDPATSVWTAGSTPPVAGTIGFVAPLPGNRALLVTEDQSITPVYDGASDSWSSSYAMASSRSRAQHVQLQDGRVLVFGGTETATDTAELFTLPTTREAADTDLGATAVGAATERDVLVRNTGSDPLFTVGVTTAGADASAFTIVTDGCSGTRVAVGGSCVVRIRFAPTGAGPRAATLAIDDNAETSATPKLAGTGTARPADPGPAGPAGPADPTPTTPLGPTTPTGPLGPTPAGPAAPGPGAPAPVVPIPCTVRSVVLAGVGSAGTPSRPRVRLTGVATGLPAGTTLRIRRDGRQVGSTRVRADGTVSATAAAPRSRRDRVAARYRLVADGGRRSAALKAVRLATIGAPVRLAGGRVRVVGRIAGVRRATRLRIERTAACGPAKARVGAVATDAQGRFRVTLAAPGAGEGATVYRIRQGRRTVTLPVVVAPAR